jgi:hypothetical protein
MKTKSLLTLFAVMCAASITAQTSSYTAAEAAKHVGASGAADGDWRGAILRESGPNGSIGSSCSSIACS